MYRPTEEDFDDLHVTACSAEPFAKPDYKSRKHPRPRRSETAGGGLYASRRYGRRSRNKTGAILAGKLHLDAFSRSASVPTE